MTGFAYRSLAAAVLLIIAWHVIFQFCGSGALESLLVGGKAKTIIFVPAEPQIARVTSWLSNQHWGFVSDVQRSRVHSEESIQKRRKKEKYHSKNGTP